MPDTTKTRIGQLTRGNVKEMAIFLIAGLIVSAVVLYSLAEFHEEISDRWLRKLDRSSMNLIHAHSSRALTALMLGLSFIGSIYAIAPVISIIALWRWQKQCIREALLMIGAVGGSAALNVGLKLYFHRHRPEVPWALTREDSFSFPSGHSVAAITLYGIFAYLLLDHVKSALGRCAILGLAVLLVWGIGVSRIYLGVHYASDVAAGYLAGGIWLSSIIGYDWKLRGAVRRMAAYTLRGTSSRN